MEVSFVERRYRLPTPVAIAMEIMYAMLVAIAMEVYEPLL